ncbi:MAG: transposase [Acidobacteriia bacterium]|nr:transposase [Terriglobia bacterium]
MQNPRVIYGILFQAVTEALLEMAADPIRLGAKLGFLAVLHTWTQRLCVVPAGGLSPDGQRWISPRKKDFFLPVKPARLSVPRQVPRVSQGGVCGRATGVLRATSRTGPPGPLCGLGSAPEI